MVSFRKFALFLIMCCLTGSTSLESLKPKEVTKKGTKKGSGEGSSPAHVPDVAVAEKDTDTDTPEQKAEKKAALEALYAHNTNDATTPSPGPVHNPNAMYGESGTETNVPVSSDKDSGEKLKLPKGSENMYAATEDDGDMTDSKPDDGPALDGPAHHDPNAKDGEGTGTNETTSSYTTTSYTKSSEKDSGEKPDEEIKHPEGSENLFATEDGDGGGAHETPYNPNEVSGTGTNEATSSDKDSDEKLKLKAPEGSENTYANSAHDDDKDAYDGPVHNPNGMYGGSGTGTKLTDGKEDSGSQAAEKTGPKKAMYGADSMYEDKGESNDPPHDPSTLYGESGTDTNAIAGAVAGADKDADSEEKVDYGLDSIYNSVPVHGEQSEEKPIPFAVYEGAACLAGFEPITSSWQDCKLAAVALKITGDSIKHVDYHTRKESQPFGTDVPQGCFRDAVTNRVYFNPGKGGSGRKKNDQNKWSDRVVCRQTNAEYSYNYGSTCPDGYLPIATTDDHCVLAAEWLGLPVDSIVLTGAKLCTVGDGILCQLDYDPSLFIGHSEL